LLNERRPDLRSCPQANPAFASRPAPRAAAAIAPKNRLQKELAAAAEPVLTSPYMPPPQMRRDYRRLLFEMPWKALLLPEKPRRDFFP